MNATWHEQPAIKPYMVVRGKNWGILDREWLVEISLMRGFYLLHVPKNYISDGPSIPWGFQWLTPITSETIAPAVMHDALYTIKGNENEITKAETDRLFWDKLVEQRVNGWRARLMWRGVQWFGRMAWNDQSTVDLLNEERGTLPRLELLSPLPTSHLV